MPEDEEFHKYVHTPRAVYAQMWMVAHRKNHVRDVIGAAVWSLVFFGLSGVNFWTQDYVFGFIAAAICLFEAWRWETQWNRLKSCDARHALLLNAIAHHDGWEVFAGQRVLPPEESMK